jgi:hypothetical protein
MKDMYDCADYDEVISEWEEGKKHFRALLNKMAKRQAEEDWRMSYSGLREIIEALELNDFILDNTEGEKMS